MGGGGGFRHGGEASEEQQQKASVRGHGGTLIASFVLFSFAGLTSLFSLYCSIIIFPWPANLKDIVFLTENGTYDQQYRVLIRGS